MTKDFAPALLAWFDARKRDLPWRRDPSAYHTLVSELMLQQTVVATVIPYFHRFVARFPDLAALAAADEAEVLALWSGLGYYARGRNLHRAARAVLAHHGGALPPDEAALRALPGVGPYTAAAIAAIAFGARTFPLDGNGARVFARVFAEDAAIDLVRVRQRLRERAEALVPVDRPGDFAQAVMDLGATVCTPTSPACQACPVARHCRARKSGRAGALPVRVQKAAKRVVALACAAIERDGRVLLVRRAAGTLLGGTFALPAGEGGGAAAIEAAEALGFAVVGPAQELGSIRHVFTHRDVTATVFRLDARGRGPAEARWHDRADDADVALSTFTRKTLGVLAGAGAAPRPRPRQRKLRMLSPATT